MPYLVDFWFGTLKRVTDVNWKIRENNWRNEHVGEGLVTIYRSEAIPDKYMIRFYNYDPDWFCQRYITTSLGHMREYNGVMVLLRTDNSIYRFKKEHNIQAYDREVMLRSTLGIIKNASLDEKISEIKRKDKMNARDINCTKIL